MNHNNIKKGGRMHTSTCGCLVKWSDIEMLAPLCAEFDMRTLPQTTQKLYDRVLLCESCKLLLRREIVAYLGQTIADAAYEARIMDNWLGFAEPSETNERASLA